MHRYLIKNISVLMAIFILAMCGTCHAEFYRYSIDELARKAKVRMQEIEKKIAEEETAKQLQETLNALQALNEKAESLFAERRYEEALAIYRSIDKLSRDNEIRRRLNSGGKREK